VGPDGEVARGGGVRQKRGRSRAGSDGIYGSPPRASAVFAAARHRHSVANLCVRALCVCV